MKVLIISVTAGYGHHATAKALAASLEEKGATVQIVDLFKYISKFLYEAVDKGYLFYTRFAPNQYGDMYRMLENDRLAIKEGITALTSTFLTGKFSNYFKDFKPDAVVATHVIAGQVLDELKRRGKIDMLAIGIVTDYTFHPFWKDMESLDYFVTASELLNYTAKRKEIPLGKVLPFGIPVDCKFAKKIDQREARTQLGLEPDMRTVLVMSGSMGFGDMLQIVEEIDALDNPLQVICVCGKNNKIYKKLSKQTFSHRVDLYEFVDNVDVMMDAADCVVTKAGGLTVTEALAKKLPMIIVNFIPGQEEYNVNFLINNGVALYVTKTFGIGEAAYYLLSFPERLDLIHRSIELIAHPDAARRLADFICGHCGEEA